MNRNVIVFAEPRRVELRSVSLPALDADSVLIRTTATSISRGTELNLYNGRTRAIRGRWYAWYPLVPGCETVGRVLEVGKNITHVAPGDRVLGSSVFGGFEGCCCAWGAQAEYALYNAPGSDFREPLKIPDQVSDEEALMAILPGVPLNGIRKKLPFVGPGVTVLVLGQGATGLAACQFLRNLGARVIAADEIDERVEIARQAGWAEAVFGRGEAIQKAVADLTDGGPDVVHDTTGSIECLSMALEMVKTGGTVLATGLYLQPMMLDLCDNIWTKGLTFSCSVGRPLELRAEILDMIARGTFDARPLISETFDIKQAAEVYRRVNDEPDRIVKPVIRWTDE